MRASIGWMAILLGTVTVSAEACSTDAEECAPGDTCTASGTPDGDAGRDGASGPAIPEPTAPGCDGTRSLRESPACIVEKIAVFVSPTGDDSAPGTKAAPFRTIKQAIEAAQALRLRVYVCEGTYAENIDVHGSLSLFGGLDCQWAVTDRRPKLTPPRGIALRLTSVTQFRLEDFDVVGSAAPAAPSESAIAMFASGSSNVRLRRVSLAAGPANAGADGPGATNWTGEATPGTPAASGAGQVVCVCSDATTSTGGKGGALGAGGATGSSQPSTAAAQNGGLGGTTCTVGSVGVKGEVGFAGKGAAMAGALAAAGWLRATDAEPGQNGMPAQGGGGGGGTTGSGIGGGGGCGGCGGSGGGPAENGGSSFGLLSFNSSDFVIEDGSVASGAGGAGGRGGAGQPGQLGGAGGPGACAGGIGGDGAGGSGGGGGAGGHSVAVAFAGTEPVLQKTSSTAGSAGAGGAGGAAGGGPGLSGLTGIKGSDGVSAAGNAF